MAGRGILWEKVCANSRDRLRQDGDLAWLRMHPPVLKVGKGSRSKRGSFLAVRTGKGPPDWIGVSDGLTILGDDKDCKSARWSTRNVKDHQAKAFDQFEAHGGTSVVLLRMADRSRWVLPWTILRPLWVEKKSVTMGQLIEVGAFRWQIRSEDEPAYDWLTPLLKWRLNHGDRPHRDGGRVREHGSVCDLSGLVLPESIENRSGEGDQLPRTTRPIPF